MANTCINICKCPVLPRETKANLLFRILWKSTIKVIDHSMHVFFSFICTPVASISVIGLVLFWAQMCGAARTQWTTPLSLISSRIT